MLGDIGRLVYDDYKECVKLATINSDMRESLLRDNGRVPKFINNLTEQLVKVKRLTRQTIKLVTYDMTEVYMKSLERFANERRMSDLDAAVKQAEINKQIEFEKSFNGTKPIVFDGES